MTACATMGACAVDSRPYGDRSPVRSRFSASKYEMEVSTMKRQIVALFLELAVTDVIYRIAVRPVVRKAIGV